MMMMMMRTMEDDKEDEDADGEIEKDEQQDDDDEEEGRKDDEKEEISKNEKAWKHNIRESHEIPQKTIKETIGGGGGPFDFINPRTLSELDLAKRVRSAAEVMLAPCVAQNVTQNLAEIFSSQKSPRSRANETIEMALSSDNSIADHENKEQQRTVVSGYLKIVINLANHL